MNETRTHEVTVDIVVFTIENEELKILLTQREDEPFKDKWAIPGGFVRLAETLDNAAQRVLCEQTQVHDVYLEQLYTFGDPLRHPRSRIITVSYVALIRSDEIKLSSEAGINVKDVGWHSVYNLPPLAFDHKIIINHALKRLRSRLEYSSLAFQLLPKKFTLTELQRTYEKILNTKMDKRNFRKKVMSLNTIKELDEHTKISSKRPARLYSFKKKSLEDSL